METLATNYTQEQLNNTLKALNADIEDGGNGVYSLWIDDKYCGGSCSIDSLVEVINTSIGLINHARDCRENEAAELEAAMTGATHAVIIDECGKAVAEINTTAKNGGYVDVAGTVTADGQPINVQSFKVSRAAKHFNQPLNSGSPLLYKGDVYYTL